MRFQYGARRPLIVAAGLILVALTGCGSTSAGQAHRSASALRRATTVLSTSAIGQSAEITYGDDGFISDRCDARSSKLHYVVFYPTSPGPHPVVFGLQGTRFLGSARCVSGTEIYRDLDPVMRSWAQAGFVAVNVEYHGTADGLFGDRTYTPNGPWDARADGTTELDVKPAIEFFLSHDAQRFGADEASGLVLFGSSSGAHSAFMVAATGIQGHRVSAVVGWSGDPDVADAGARAQSALDFYMNATPGSEREAFGDPIHRIQPSAPPEYIANALNEFINPASAIGFARRCRTLHIPVWERLPNTSAHALGYMDYAFTDKSPEVSVPTARVGETVLQDSILFAQSELARLASNRTGPSAN